MEIPKEHSVVLFATPIAPIPVGTYDNYGKALMALQERVLGTVYYTYFCRFEPCLPDGNRKNDTSVSCTGRQPNQCYPTPDEERCEEDCGDPKRSYIEGWINPDRFCPGDEATKRLPNIEAFRKLARQDGNPATISPVDLAASFLKETQFCFLTRFVELKPIRDVLGRPLSSFLSFQMDQRLIDAAHSLMPTKEAGDGTPQEIGLGLLILLAENRIDLCELKRRVERL